MNRLTRYGQQSNGYRRLPRARAHSERSLARLRSATRAKERRNGLAPARTPAALLQAVPVVRRRAMRAVIDGLAKQQHVRQVCRSRGIAVETWRAIMLNDLRDADYRTGRNMRTSQVVAAARVNRDPYTVYRARRVSVDLGIMVELYRGRELTRHERLSLITEHPKHRQRGIPNIFAFTLWRLRQRRRISTPSPGMYAQVASFAALPLGGYLAYQSHLGLTALSEAAEAARESVPPAAAPSACRKRRRRSPGLSLAIGLLAQPGMYPLLAGVRAGTLTGLLGPYQRGGWSAGDLSRVLLAEADRRGISTMAPARNPWGLLKTLLSGVLPEAMPGLRSEPEPCGRPECDGFGWLRGHEAKPCPVCPPSVRTCRDEPPGW